jgi:hypothetical protein
VIGQITTRQPASDAGQRLTEKRESRLRGVQAARPAAEHGGINRGSGRPDVNPVVMFIVRLLAAASMADDGIAFTTGASPQDDFGAACGPVGLELVRRYGKRDEQNRSSSELCPSGVDLPRSQPEAELLPPEEKSNWKRIQLPGYGFLGV